MRNHPAQLSPELLEIAEQKLESIAEPQSPEWSEDSLALAFTDIHLDSLRYTHELGKWSRWNGTHWQQDSTCRIYDLVRAFNREQAIDASRSDSVATGKRIASANAIAAIEHLARVDQRTAAIADQWDRNIWQLNTPTGTVDLQSGNLLPHERLAYHSKVTTVGPAASIPELWLKFLHRITGDNEELETYLQRVAGYCLSGSTIEHALFFLYGKGANGKSVFINTLGGILCHYFATTPADVFTVQRGGEAHPTGLAGLAGIRLAVATEVESGARLAESQVKALTGGDLITARKMRQDFFQFRPAFKLLISGNHKPSLRTVDEGIRRRFHLIPFTVTIPPEERDKNLTDKLKTEWPQILQWCIDGCLSWQREGLNPPAIVRDATEDYLSDEDALGRWMAERCILGNGEHAASSELFRDWKNWAEPNNEFVGSQRRFSMNLDGRNGIALTRNRAERLFRGISLRGDIASYSAGENER
jgi:P4 family phage/plasmid primase-like protien